MIQLDMYTTDMIHRIVDITFETALEQRRPSSIYKPFIYPDGDKWCALYGENIQEGVAGFGETPAEAFAEFDKNWVGQHASPTASPPD